MWILWPTIWKNTGQEKAQWTLIQCPRELKGQGAKGEGITKDRVKNSMEEEIQGCEIAE